MGVVVLCSWIAWRYAPIRAIDRFDSWKKEAVYRVSTRMSTRSPIKRVDSAEPIVFNPAEGVSETSGDWSKMLDDEGNTYYMNEQTGETSWTLPSEV